jgi:hypothetical protein
MKATLRSFVSPAVAFLFAVVSVTGFLMLFDIDHVEDLHKWMGLAFAITGVLHLAVNWRALVDIFSWSQNHFIGFYDISHLCSLTAGNWRQRSRYF